MTTSANAVRGRQGPLSQQAKQKLLDAVIDQTAANQKTFGAFRTTPSPAVPAAPDESGAPGAVDLQVVTESGHSSYEQIDPAQLHVGSDTIIRYAVGRLDDLERDIEFGSAQHDPIIVDAQNRVLVHNRLALAFQAVARRRRAAMKPPILATVRRVHINPEGGAIMNVRNNLLHERYSPMDIATICETFIEKFGYTQQRVAALFGTTQPWVSNQLLLLALPPEIKDRIHLPKGAPGHLSVEAAWRFAKLSDSERQNFLVHAEQAGERVTAASINRFVAASRNAKANPALPAASEIDPNDPRLRVRPKPMAPRTDAEVVALIEGWGRDMTSMQKDPLCRLAVYINMWRLGSITTDGLQAEARRLLPLVA